MSFRARFLPWPSRYPMLLLMLAAIVGILVAELQAFTPGLGLGLVTLLVGLYFAYRPGLATALPLICLGFIFWHTQRLAETFDHPVRQHLLTRPDSAETATVQGRLYPWSEGAELDQATALCEVTHLKWSQETHFTPQKLSVKVRLPEGYSLTSPGIYTLQGRLSLPAPPSNPGQFDAVTYSLRMGWVATMKAQEITLEKADALALRFRLLHAAEASRQWITQRLTQGLESQPTQAGVILAMALGASDAAGKDIEDAFRDSGTLHVFAVSGLHVVMLAHIASMGLSWLGRQRLSIVLILLVFAYAFITGWRPSAARAAIMTAFVLAAPLLNRKSQVINILGAVALLLLTAETHLLFMPGFQLSFFVLLAIVMIASGLLTFTHSWSELDPYLPPALATYGQRCGSRLRMWAAALLFSSIAAWFGSLPFLLGHFQTFSPVALVSNLVLVPASELCLLLSCISLVFSSLHWGWAVTAFNQLNAHLASFMVAAATWFAAWPGANHPVNVRLQVAAPEAEMQVFQLPFGSGAAYLASGSQHWLLDTGNEDQWRYVLRPFLRQAGVNQLQGLILSHSDISHVGATPWVLAAQGRPTLHTSRLEPWKPDPPFSSLKKLSTQIPPDSPLWQRHEQGQIIPLAPQETQPITAQVLHPGPRDLHEKADDRGLVLMIHLGAFRVLWLNDAGFITEKRLLEKPDTLRCDLLVRHQHSADIAGLTELLLAAQPQAIISSNDRYSPEETLPQRLRDFCQQQQVPLFDLEADGSVRLEIHGVQGQLKAFKSARSVILQPRQP